MKARVIKKVILNDLPSASGVEIIDGVIYVIGDDSPMLYCLDHNLKIIHKVALFETEDFVTGRMPKKIKPDFEAMTELVINQNKYILVMGSGSTEKRDGTYLIKLPNKFNNKFFVQQVSFQNLYNLLRSNPEITGNDGGVLNIEGAAANQEHFILFNRANKSARNSVIKFKLEEILVFLLENNELVPFPSLEYHDLPCIKNIHSGFSGASFYEEKLFFTSSVEDSVDAIQDGEVLGSFIGYFEVLSADYIRGGNAEALSSVKDCAIIEENGNTYIGKVESISIYEKESATKYIAIAVTDNDMGASEILMVEIDLAD